MPVFNFKCPECGAVDKQLLSISESQQPVACRKTPGCKGILMRVIKVPSMVHKEVIDNGILVRRVERDIDVDKLTADRASKDYRKPD